MAFLLPKEAPAFKISETFLADTQKSRNLHKTKNASVACAGEKAEPLFGRLV
jgi:hypothetical protein